MAAVISLGYPFWCYCQWEGTVLECENGCGVSRPEVDDTDRLTVSRRLLADAVSSLVDSARACAAAGREAVPKTLDCPAGRSVTVDVAIAGATSLWVCFSPESTLRLAPRTSRTDPVFDPCALRSALLTLAYLSLDTPMSFSSTLCLSTALRFLHSLATIGLPWHF